MANFIQGELPFNPLLAGQLDASSTFSANDPLSHVAYSIAAIDLYHQGETKRIGEIQADIPTAPKDITDVMAGSGDALKKAIETNKQAGANNCGLFDIPCYFSKAGLTGDLIKDYGKRIGLLLVAIIIGVIAILAIYRGK